MTNRQTAIDALTHLGIRPERAAELISDAELESLPTPDQQAADQRRHPVHRIQVTAEGRGAHAWATQHLATPTPGGVPFYAPFPVTGGTFVITDATPTLIRELPRRIGPAAEPAVESRVELALYFDPQHVQAVPFTGHTTLLSWILRAIDTLPDAGLLLDRSHIRIDIQRDRP